MKLWAGAGGKGRDAGAPAAPSSAAARAGAKLRMPGAPAGPPVNTPVIEEKAAAAAPVDLPPRADPILTIIRYLARRWGRPESTDVILAGLPLVDGVLTGSLIPRALERGGLVAKPKMVPLKALADFDFPAFVASRSGELLLIIERSGRNKLLCFDPAKNAEIEIQTNTKDWRYRHQLLLIKQQEEQGVVDNDHRPAAQRDWLRTAMAGHGRSLALVLLAATFIFLFALAMPLFSMNVYDRVLPNAAGSTLWVLSIGVASVFAFDFLL